MSNNYNNANFNSIAHNKDENKKYDHPYISNINNTNESVIPLQVFQTWHTKNLLPHIQNRVNDLKSKNPEFTYHLYDDNDCRNFISQNFSNDVLRAYDMLIPGAYKADLWRLCVLYIHGGIYIDIKLTTINNFKLIELTKSEHLVKDRPYLTIYNALMVCKAKTPILLTLINAIVNNVKNRYYGKCPLDPTGPGLIGKVLYKSKIPVNVDMYHFYKGGYIVYNNTFVISTQYDEYNIYRKNNNNYYGLLWIHKKIYK